MSSNIYLQHFNKPIQLQNYITGHIKYIYISVMIWDWIGEYHHVLTFTKWDTQANAKRFNGYACFVVHTICLFIFSISRPDKDKRKKRQNKHLVLTEIFCLVCARKENKFLAYGSDSNISSSVNRLLKRFGKGGSDCISGYLVCRYISSSQRSLKSLSRENDESAEVREIKDSLKMMTTL